MASGSVQGFDEVLKGEFLKFLKLSDQIGGEVKAQECEKIILQMNAFMNLNPVMSKVAEQAFHAQRDFLVVAAGRAKPSQNELRGMLKVTSEKMLAVKEFPDKNRDHEYFKHLSSVSEGIEALGWVSHEPSCKPDVFVKDRIDAAQFYTNQVLNRFKDKGTEHADWARALIGALKELQSYTKKHHSAGLTWGK